MRPPVLLLVSVGLNLIFAGALFFGVRTLSNTPAPPAIAAVELPPATQIKTNFVVRRQNFTWEEVESDNYVTYIKNLRDIGCPPSTIRDIIVADVNQLYAHRRATDVVSADHQWWTSEPNLDVIQKAAEKLRAMENERRVLLTRLLGPDWETVSNPLPPATRTGVSLTGPILGELPGQTKQAVYDVAAQTQQKIEAYMEAQQREGKTVDPMELAKMRQDSRLELTKLLNPEQMEEFLLRYSNTAYAMRAELHGLDLSPEEFRNLFQARDAIEQQTEIQYSGTDPVKLKRKQELENERDAVTEKALGPERYANYALNQDPLFQQSRATAEQIGAPAELVLPIYQINQLTEAERQRISADLTLSNDEKIDAISAAEAERKKTLEKILGPEYMKQYLETR